MYEPNDIVNIAIIKTKIRFVNYRNILKAISNRDFQGRYPELDNYTPFSSKQIFFINIDKKLIFNMYDDRGLDVIGVDLKTIKALYHKHNDWILDYDHKRIDNQFI